MMGWGGRDGLGHMTQNHGKESFRGDRLTDAERQAMLDRLDAGEEKNPAKQKRGMPRVVFRKTGVSVRVHHPGGSTSNSLVTTRNLSAGGVSFLYQGFLHKNTRIEIMLRRRVGGEDVISGTVQHCALVNKTFHLIGMRFDTKIFPKLYLDPSEWGVLDDSAPVDASTLAGTVLHLDEQELDRMLLGHFLKGTRIKLISCASILDALVQIKENAIDCILCDLNLSGTSGTDGINKFRDAGFTGPVAIITAETSATRVRAAQEAGAGAVLSKPYDQHKLLSLLSTWMMGGASTEEPIFSTLADQAQMLPLIEQYVTKARVLGRDLRRQIEARSVIGVRNICQMLKGTAMGFGYAEVSDIARDAVKCLDASNSLRDAMGALQQLETACMRLSAKAPPATPAAA
jgi:CheY-like chemotaxis protein